MFVVLVFFFQAEDGIRDLVRSRGLGDVYKRQDLRLPDMSGFEVLDEIRKDASLSNVPVVVFTGRELSVEEDAELHTMARSIVVKGVESPERLLDETSLFLHRVITELPIEKQRMLEKLNSSDKDLVGRTALLVDDDARNIFALSSVLERRGMKVLTATTGSEAVTLVESNPEIAIVLMDIMMPQMDGYQTMGVIRQNPAFRRLPIIADEHVDIDFGTVRLLPDECRRIGMHKPLIVSDAGVRDAGVLAEVLAALGGLAHAVFDQTPSNPTEAGVRAACAVYQAEGCDGLVAVGGGSSIDLAKGMAIATTHEGPLKTYATIEGGSPLITERVAPLIAVPTTAGTGSEVARGAIVIVDDGRKLGFHSWHLMPKAALLDPDPVSYTHLRAHETVLDLVCRLLLEKTNKCRVTHERCTPTTRLT